jgi:hypothetical protein
MIAKTPVQSRTKRRYGARCDTTKVKPEATWPDYYDAFHKLSYRQHVYVTQITLVTPSTPSVSSSPPWYPHTSLPNQHKAFMISTTTDSSSACCRPVPPILSKTIRSHGISLVDGCLGTREGGGITVQQTRLIRWPDVFGLEFVVREVARRTGTPASDFCRTLDNVCCRVTFVI